LLVHAASAQLSNTSFEDLNSSSMPSFWQGNLVILPVWIDPDGHAHTDSVVYDGGANYGLSADAHSGQRAIELRNAFNYTTNTPIVATWSATPIEEGYLGFPQVEVLANEVPLSIGFFAKFTPLAGDSAWVTAVVRNATEDTIGLGTLAIHGTYATYTAFTVPIAYTSADAPATLQVSFANARPGGQVTQGTRFLIDDVSVTSSPLGLAELATGPDVLLYPDPAEDVFTVRCEAPITRVQATDVTGRTSALSHTPNGSVDCSGLAAGLYLVRINTPRGEALRKLVVR
jgi:hypothetical protein